VTLVSPAHDSIDELAVPRYENAKVLPPMDTATVIFEYVLVSPASSASAGDVATPF
jgi:hypothetical protein